MQGSHAAVLRSGRWFQSLPEALQGQLLEAAVPRELAAGELLFRRGDECSGLFAVVEGSVRIVGLGESGKEVLLTLAEPPAWFGEIAVFDCAARTHDAIAEGPSRLVQVPQGALTTILDKQPVLWRFLGTLMSAKLRLLFTFVEDASVRPLKARLARRLLLMAGAYGEWNDRSRRVLELRQEQLAMMLAASRQTVNAVLKELAAAGLVRVAYGQVELLDREGLQALQDERS